MPPVKNSISAGIYSVTEWKRGWILVELTHLEHYSFVYSII
jgi:hypothetical protein